MRVVSLLPAATEIVAALGAANRLVGVSHECDWPPDVVRALPRVTGTALDPSLPSGEIDRAMAAAKREGRSPVTLDRDALARLAPDLILGQSVCDVCSVGEGDVAQAAAALPRAPRVVTLHAHSLDGVWNDMLRVGEALDLQAEGEELVAGLRYRLRHVTAHHAPLTAHPRVLVIEWVEPPYVAGHWVPELVAAAGGVDVAARPGDRSVMRSWTELRRLAPQVVVIALCGFDVSRAKRELFALRDPEARALLDAARVAFLDGNAYTSRPGPRLVDGAELLAQLIVG